MRETESAIGIACTQAGALMSAQYEGMIKRAQHAFAARNGLFGALLARGGYEGMRKVFERPYGGFLAMFSAGNDRNPPWKIHEVSLHYIIKIPAREAELSPLSRLSLASARSGTPS